MRAPDLLCFSHLRWNHVYQRPQHLLARATLSRRVFFVEEPIFAPGPARLEQQVSPEGVVIAVPHLPPDLEAEAIEGLQRELLEELRREHAIERFVLWTWTPRSLGFTHHLSPMAVVFDCMDELSSFEDATPAFEERGTALLACADLVFTGGESQFEHKRALHPDVHLFPSSVDVPHFARARGPQDDPEDQAPVRRPRIGYFGVIDERMDLELLRYVAALRPDFEFVLIGPIVKIDPATLPDAPNLHWLGAKPYEELPSYAAGWDVAILPFARNDATRFISPTKTPEYLAAGLPVVSTSIRDVIRPYGEAGLVRIADHPVAFALAIDCALVEPADARRAVADRFLANLSWDRTWARMAAELERVLGLRRRAPVRAGSATRLTTTGADVHAPLARST